jgi:hypothetical protein
MAAGTEIRMSEFTRPYGAPSEAQGRREPAPQEPPDYLALAGRQLQDVTRFVDDMASGDPARVNGEKVIELRLKLAAGYTELAAIQYGLPADDGYEDFDQA